jgi:RNA polymerase sigma factor (sigma-70 family)
MSGVAFQHVATHLLRCDSQLRGPTDAELLVRFATARDEGAFAELVARHAGLVRGIARRWVRDAHTAEDVCQAAFLVLASRAGAIKWTATVGPWLHATAVRIARKALRRVKPATGGSSAEVASPTADPASELAWAESCRALDEELAALPEVLRGPLVLCYLEGHTRDEAAQVLGCSLPMLKRRLERGRNLLRDRLTRRGVTLPAVGIGLLACDLTTATGVEVTTRAAVAFVTRGTTSPAVGALLRSSRNGLAVKAVALVTAGLVACGVCLASFTHATTANPDAPPNAPVSASRSGDPPPSADPTSAPKDEKTKADAAGEALPAFALARLGSVHLRAWGAFERLAFSPDGTKIASWGGDLYTTNELAIWDTKTGRALRRIDLTGARIDQLLWLPDGRGVALVRSSYDDPVPFIWEFTNEKTAKPEVKPRKQGVGTIAVPAGPVQDNEHDSCFAISPDGKMLAIGKAGELDAEREVQLWELETGVKVNGLKPLKGGVLHPANCGELYFTPDAKGLVVFTPAKHLGDNKFEGEQLVTVWNVKTGKELSRFKAPRPATNGRPAVALSNTTLAIGQEDSDTSLWDLATGKERKLATEHKSKKPGRGYGTYCVAFTPDGKTLITGGRDHVTKLWDLSSGKLLQALAGHHTWVETLAVAPNAKLIASAGQDGQIRLWDPATGADACPLPGHKYAVWSVALSADATYAVTAGWDNTVRWWDATTGAERRSVTVADGVHGLVLSPDGKVVLAATEEGKLLMWDRETGRPVPADLPSEAKCEQLSFTPDGKHLIASSGPKVTIWEWPALKLARSIDLPKPDKKALPDPPGNAENQCQVAAVSPDARWLVTIAHCYWYRERDGLRYGYASHGVVDVWDFATGKRLRRLAESQGTFRTGTFTADGRFVLIGAGGTIIQMDGSEGETFQGETTLLDPIAGRVVRSFDVPPIPERVSHRYSGTSALSPDGRTLYVSYNTGEIVCYEVATGKPRRTLTGHRGYIGGLALSADGRRLLSGSHDGTALVWDVTLAGASAPRPKPLTEAEAAKLWEALERDNTKAAFAALTELAASPEQALALMKRHIKPAPNAPTDATLDRIFADLGSEEFATREKASKELTEYGELAVPGVRKRLGGSSSAEARQRAAAFLKEFDKSSLSATRLGQIRSVELLEGLGTPEAKKMLTEVAGGAGGAPLTLDATAALKRLGKP